MKHIKNFEKLSYLKYKSKVIDCGYYIQSQIPDNGFFDWEYDEINPDLSIQIDFYYNKNVEDEIIEKACEFFDKYGLEYNFGYGVHSLAPDNIYEQEKISVYVPNDIIIKFSNYFNIIQKYNL